MLLTSTTESGVSKWKASRSSLFWYFYFLCDVKLKFVVHPTLSESISKVNYTEDGEIYGYSNSKATCTVRSDADLTPDLKWKKAKGFSILAVVCGVSGILLVSGYHFDKFLIFSVVMFLFASISQGITFLFFQSNGCSKLPRSVDYKNTTLVTSSPSESCTLANGAKLGITAVALWLFCCVIASILCCANCKEGKKRGKNFQNIYLNNIPIQQDPGLQQDPEAQQLLGGTVIAVVAAVAGGAASQGGKERAAIVGGAESQHYGTFTCFSTSHPS